MTRSQLIEHRVGEFLDGYFGAGPGGWDRFEMRDAIHALRAAYMEPEIPGVQACPDCGSTYFNRAGAKVLDEAREVGYNQAVTEAVFAIDHAVHQDGCGYSCDLENCQKAITALTKKNPSNA